MDNGLLEEKHVCFVRENIKKKYHTRPDIPDNMYDLVDGKYIKLMREAWSTNPDDRPSMPAIVHELQRICKISGPSPLQEPSGPNTNGGPKAEEKAQQLRVEKEKEKILKEKDEEIARLKRDSFFFKLLLTLLLIILFTYFLYRYYPLYYYYQLPAPP